LARPSTPSCPSAKWTAKTWGPEQVRPRGVKLCGRLEGIRPRATEISPGQPCAVRERGYNAFNSSSSTAPRERGDQARRAWWVRVRRLPGGTTICAHSQAYRTGFAFGSAPILDAAGVSHTRSITGWRHKRLRDRSERRSIPMSDPLRLHPLGEPPSAIVSPR